LRFWKAKRLYFECQKCFYGSKQLFWKSEIVQFAKINFSADMPTFSNKNPNFDHLESFAVNQIFAIPLKRRHILQKAD